MGSPRQIRGCAGRALGTLVLVTLSTGCDLVSAPVCTTSVEPGIVVEVYHADTGEPAAEGARGRVRDGTFSDSLWVHGARDGRLHSLAGAWERAGTYEVEVVKEGFLTWTREDVEVEEGECHVRTVELRADLVPSP
ncbi:MAG: hypothetical protein ACOC9N_03075 [Gemmatimonadota bacterium]